MEFTRSRSAEGVELRVAGRLDGYHANQLLEELERLVREGERQVRLDLAGVSYLSSAGIGVLVKCRQDLSKLGGNLVVAVASAPVQRVLEMAKLAALLVAGDEGVGRWGVGAGGGVTGAGGEGVGAQVEVEAIAPGERLRRRIVGNPEVLRGVLMDETSACRLRVGEVTLAVGLGAFGTSFERCSDRIGEFLAVAGAAAYQPGDGSNVADGMAAAGELIVVYAEVCEGRFSHRIRFEGVSVGELEKACREATGGEDVGVALVAESARGGMVAAGVGGRVHAARFRAGVGVGSELGPAVGELFGSGTPARVERLEEQDRSVGRGWCWTGRL